MSADTRRSSLMVNLPFGRVFPNPDGSITELDFEHMLMSYRMQADAPPVPPISVEDPISGIISLGIRQGWIINTGA